MPESVIRLIDGKARVEDDAWRVVTADAPGIGAGPVIVPLSIWNARRDELLARAGPVGAWLSPDEEPAQLAPDLARLSLVAVHFPKWGDGRGYSTGTLLRHRFGWREELRAFGDIGRDHLFYLARCGFDSFRLPPQRDAHAALASLSDFSLRYQGAVDDPVPLFRKRLGSALSPLNGDRIQWTAGGAR